MIPDKNTEDYLHRRRSPSQRAWATNAFLLMGGAIYLKKGHLKPNLESAPF